MRQSEIPPLMREICKAIDHQPRNTDVGTRRTIALKASRLSDRAFYEDLSLEGQEWVNSAITAIEKDEKIPHFDFDVQDPATIERKPGESKRVAMFRSMIEHADWSPNEWQESMVLSQLAPNFDTVRTTKHIFHSMLCAMRDGGCLSEKGLALFDKPLFQFSKAKGGKQ